MKQIIAIAFIAALGFAGAAHAMPVAPVQADGLATQIAQGCGPGLTRNAFGKCRPAFIVRGCGPGRHRNAIGICRPNR